MLTVSYLVHYDHILENATGQNETASLLQNATKVYYIMHQMFYFKMRQFYYEMGRLLQNMSILLQNSAIISKCDVY